jgi:hypothetical protein
VCVCALTHTHAHTRVRCITGLAFALSRALSPTHSRIVCQYTHTPPPPSPPLSPTGVDCVCGDSASLRSPSLFAPSSLSLSLCLSLCLSRSLTVEALQNYSSLSRAPSSLSLSLSLTRQRCLRCRDKARRRTHPFPFLFLFLAHVVASQRR